MIDLLVVAIGILIRLVGIRQLGQNFSGQIRFPERLVMTGVYRYIRHPLYLGNMVVLWGLCLGGGTVGAAVAILAFVVFYDRSDNEETVMIVKFGKEYLDYIERTDRFFPFKLLPWRGVCRN